MEHSHLALGRAQSARAKGPRSRYGVSFVGRAPNARPSLRSICQLLGENRFSRHNRQHAFVFSQVPSNCCLRHIPQCEASGCLGAYPAAQDSELLEEVALLAKGTVRIGCSLHRRTNSRCFRTVEGQSRRHALGVLRRTGGSAPRHLGGA